MILPQQKSKNDPSTKTIDGWWNLDRERERLINL